MWEVWAYGNDNTGELPVLTKRLIGVAASRQEAMELFSLLQEGETPEIVEADEQSMDPDRPVVVEEIGKEIDMWEVWALSTGRNDDGLPIIVERKIGMAATEEEAIDLFSLLREDETPAIVEAVAA